MSIQFKNISFCYDKSTELSTLTDVSFSINKGEYVCILGHNGSGKSTLAKLLVGLLQPDSGQILYQGEEINSKNIQKFRSKFGIVFQNPDNQFIGSTVADDIAFGLENRNIDPKEMDSIINQVLLDVNMLKYINHEPTKLSGGQKQRIALATTLAFNPEVIILDEATSMLDPLGKDKINKLVRKIHQKNNPTIISITHDVEEIVFADRIIILNQGKVVKNAITNEIFDQPQLLLDNNLDLPFALKMSLRLKEKGLPIKPSYKFEEVVSQLCRLKSKI